MSNHRPGHIASAPAGFEAGWCASDLGTYRPCEFTYEVYPHESLPPLDAARFTGAFEWLGEPGGPVPERGKTIGELARSLVGHGLSLPQDFVTFQTSANLWHTLDEVSVTACWTDISAPLPSPLEKGAFLVRFLRDQQDCVIWYLYLRPSGEAFVVSSPVEYESAYEECGPVESHERSSGWNDVAAHRSALLWCAPSFEQFAYRFWAENMLWDAVNGGDLLDIAPDLRDYLRHYEPGSGVATVR